MEECETNQSLHCDIREGDLVVTSPVINNVLEGATCKAERGGEEMSAKNEGED